jgi:Arc/MetJ family transcription regulator
MKTTMDLPISLLDEAQRLLETSTKKETVIEALKKVVEMRKRQAIFFNKGKLDLKIDLDAIRER